VFVSIKPLHVSVFFYDHLQGVLRCALWRYYSSRWFTFVEFVLLHSMWPHVYVICVCLVFLSVGDLQITNRQEFFVSRYLQDLNYKHSYFNFNTCTVHLLLFCTTTNKWTIISQIITLPRVSTLSFHPQVACNHYHAKLHKYFKCSCW
jgi:hypothetical protein